MIFIIDKSKKEAFLNALTEYKKLKDTTYPLDLLSYDQNPNNKSLDLNIENDENRAKLEAILRNHEQPKPPSSLQNSLNLYKLGDLYTEEYKKRRKRRKKSSEKCLERVWNNIKDFWNGPEENLDYIVLALVILFVLFLIFLLSFY
jgi:hypothetical protein